MNSSYAKIITFLLVCVTACELTAVVLSSSQSEFHFDDATGRLIDSRSAGRSWGGCVDLYELERISEITDACELGDRVFEMTQPDADTVIYRCENPELPGVVIEKHCRLNAEGKLIRQVHFRGNDPDTIIRYFVAYRSPDDALERNAVQDFWMSDTILSSAPDGARTLLIRRTGVNGRPVMRSQGKSQESQWARLRIMADFLRVGEAVGGEVTYNFVPDSDFVVLQRELTREYRQWTKQEVTSEWSRGLLADVMYVTDQDQDFLTLCRDYPISGTIWFLNPPWGNWFADSDPPMSNFLPGNVRTIAPAFKAQFPKYRLAAYTNGCVDDASNFFRDFQQGVLKHPDRSPWSSTIISDYKVRPSYLLRINDPEVRQYMINMHCDRTAGWDLDFHYTDGPGFFHEEPDWDRREVVQNYHWLDYLEQLLNALRVLKPEAVIFANYFMPYSAINYLELRDGHWQQMAGEHWREIAPELLGFKMTLPSWNTLVFTYGHAAAEPAFSAYTVLYGAAGHKGAIWRHPYTLAALRARGGELRPEILSPRWYDEADGDFEALLFSFEGGRKTVVNLLGHADRTEPVRLRWNAQAAGMTPGKRYRAELLSAAPCVVGEDNFDKITVVPFDFPEVCPEEVEIALPVAYMTVQSLVIEECL